MLWKKLFGKKIGLLPYIREDVHSISTSSPQIYGWELQKFAIPSVWSKTQGEGVVVAVIDTGCDIYHDDLKENVLVGKNFINPGHAPLDVVGHGSHVASTIAASDNGTGIVGVAPKSKILPIKSLGDDGSGNMRDIADGIRWAADQKADLITMSLGSPGPAKMIEDAINYAVSKGSVIFCAAGNDGPATDIMYPAKYEHTVAIGAIDEDLNRTNFTCSGDTLDFLAPGHNILGCVPGNRYALMSGTSMSNPFAVGCAALVLSYYRKIHRSVPRTSEDYIRIFREHAIPLKNAQYYNQKKYQGYGIINVSESLK
jgi:subtilisin family serine protease